MVLDNIEYDTTTLVQLVNKPTDPNIIDHASKKAQSASPQTLPDPDIIGHASKETKSESSPTLTDPNVIGHVKNHITKPLQNQL